MKGIIRTKSSLHHRRATYLGLVLVFTLTLMWAVLWLLQAPSLLAKPAPDAFPSDGQTQLSTNQDLALASVVTDTRYVATSGDNVGNDCTQAIAPCATIQYAVDQVVAGGAVLVAAGTYLDVVTHTVGPTIYTQTVHISKSVSIHGGYSTADNFATVEPIANAVTIDGENMHRAVYIEAGGTVTLTGLFVANGLATDTGDPEYGGGIYNAGSNLTISSTWIISNVAQFGGGLYHGDGDLNMHNTVVADNGNPNTQKGGGGGLYIADGLAVVESSTFVANGANISTTLLPSGDGGAIYQVAGDLDLYNNIFASNTADMGSAVFISATATISDDYNLYDGNLPAPATNFVTGTNSLSGTADFIDNFYHIGPNSDAKDNGTSGVALAVDFELDPRPLPAGGLFDIGADERVQLSDFVFTPPTQTAVIDPNAAFTYTHWLTNSGEAADSYEFSMSNQSVPPGGGWSYSLSPTQTAVLTTGESVSVTLVVTAGPVGGYMDISTVTATSVGFGLARSVMDTTTISSTPGVLIEPPRADSGSPNDVVVYTHTLTNTGTGIDQFSVQVAGANPPGWPITVVPTQTGILQPMESLEVMVWVSIPSGVPAGITHEVSIEAASMAPGVTDLVTDTTTVEGGYGLSLEPDHDLSILAPMTVVYTHTLTNIGNISDTVMITATGTPLTPSWTVSVTPTAVALDALESAIISVTVDVPLTATMGISHVTSVTATMTNSPTVQANAYNTTTLAVTPGVMITPSAQMVITNAGTLVEYEHEIINTGNVSDTFVLTATSTQGWLTGFTGGPLPVLQPGESVTVTLMVSVPLGAPGGTQDITTLTATSSQDSGVSDSAVDTTEVISQTGFGLLFEPDNLRVVPSPSTVVYTHTLTNTGDGPDSFAFTGTSSQGWTVDVPPTLSLAAAATATVNVTLTVPISSEGLVDFMDVTAVSINDPTAVATVTNTTVVSGLQGTGDVVIEPDRSQTGFGGQSVLYTHTVTNTGNITDSYALSVVSSMGWVVSVEPTNLFGIVPQEGRAVTVTVNVPGGAPLGVTDMTTVTVSSLTLVTVTDTAVDTTQVGSSYGLLFEPDRSATVSADSTVTYTHFLTNTGNTTDTYDFAATSSNGWAIQLPPMLTLNPGVSGTVMVTLTVPISSEGLVDVMQVTATSVNDPTVSGMVIDTTTVSGTLGLPGVVIEPNGMQFASPGQVVVYAHTVTNTGEFIDGYSLNVVSSLAWTVSVTPTTLFNVMPQESRPVMVTVNVPPGANIGDTDMTTVTVTSLTVMTATDSAVDTTQVGGSAPLLFEPNRTMTVSAGSTVTYTHFLTNTSSTTSFYGIAATSSHSWTTQVSPVVVSLNPGEGKTITVTLDVPPAASGLTDIMVVRAVNPSYSAEVTDTTIVLGEPITLSVVIEPDNSNVGTPGQVLLYSHAVTNTSSVTEEFRIDAVSSLNWAVAVSQGSVTLGPNESMPILVTVAIPTTATNGTQDITTVTATSVTDSTVSDQAQDTTTVGEPPANPTVYLPFVAKPVATPPVTPTPITPTPPTPTPTPTPSTPTPATPTPGTPTITPTPCSSTGIDLIVTRIQIVPGSPTAGQPVSVYVTIRNRGSVDVPYGNNFYVDFYVDELPVPVIPGVRYAGIQGADMTAGTSVTYLMDLPSDTYSFSGGSHQMYAQVDTDNTVNECPNEDNNVLGPITISVSGFSEENGNEEMRESGPRVTPTPGLLLDDNVGPAPVGTPLPSATPTLSPVEVQKP